MGVHYSLGVHYVVHGGLCPRRLLMSHVVYRVNRPPLFKCPGVRLSSGARLSPTVKDNHRLIFIEAMTSRPTADWQPIGCCCQTARTIRSAQDGTLRPKKKNQSGSKEKKESPVRHEDWLGEDPDRPHGYSRLWAQRRPFTTQGFSAH